MEMEMEMSKTADEVFTTLTSMWERAGLQAEPWDVRMMRARAIDLARLERKATATGDAAEREAYAEAARDGLDHVRALIAIRQEAAKRLSAEEFFTTILPLLAKLLPVLIGLLAA